MNNNERLQNYNNTGGADRQDPRVKQLAVDVLRWLPYDPHDNQMLVIVALAHFLLYAPERSVFILGGYAGTGKTSLTGAIVKALHQQGPYFLPPQAVPPRCWLPIRDSPPSPSTAKSTASRATALMPSDSPITSTPTRCLL